MMRNNDSSTTSGTSILHLFSLKIVTAINIVLAIAMLLCVPANYVSPARITTLFAFWALLFPALLCLNAFTALCWLLTKHKSRALISACAIALCWQSAIRTFSLPLSPKAETTDNTTTLITYNVANFGWENKQTPILAYLDSINPDIICLQEFTTRPNNKYLTEQDILKALKRYPYHSICYASTNKTRKFGIATFSKYPIIKHNTILKDGGNAAQYTDISVHDDTLRIINCHLKSFSLRPKDKQSLDQSMATPNAQTLKEAENTMRERMAPRYRARAKQADMVADIVRNTTTPLIVCGDFNDTPVSYTYHTIRGHNLNDAHQQLGTAFGNTFYHKKIGVRIDHILHTNDIYLTSFVRLNAKYSDHYPLLTSFNIEQQ